MYQILRIQKLKTPKSVGCSIAHSYRDQNTPNADPARLNQNQFAGAKTGAHAKKRFDEKLSTVKGKIRSNAVHGIEFLVTASPVWFEGKTKKEQSTYFNESLKWLKKEFGEDNFISAGVHHDETTAHMFAYFIPLKDQKLNSKHYIGGHRDRLVNLQTEFHNDVSKKFGLERGQQGSKARHTTIKKWYAMIANVINLPKISKAEQIRDFFSGDSNSKLQAAAAAAVDAQIQRDRSLGQVKAAREALKRLESATERLEQMDKLEIALEKSDQKVKSFEKEIGSLKDLLEMNRDVIEANTRKILGIKPEPVAPVITTNQKIESSPPLNPYTP